MKFLAYSNRPGTDKNITNATMCHAAQFHWLLPPHTHCPVVEGREVCAQQDVHRGTRLLLRT